MTDLGAVETVVKDAFLLADYVDDGLDIVGRCSSVDSGRRVRFRIHGFRFSVNLIRLAIRS